MRSNINAIGVRTGLQQVLLLSLRVKMNREVGPFLINVGILFDVISSIKLSRCPF